MSVGYVLEYVGRVDRKEASLPCYVVVPSTVLESWSLEETTVVEGTMNGTDLGRRTLKPWDDDRWFMELPRALCRKASVSVGDRVKLRISVACTELPPELASLIEAEARARRAWDAMSRSQRRMLREHVIAARRAETRQRRARKALLGGPG